MIEKCMVWLFLSIGAMWDLKKKSIPTVYLWLFALVGVVFSVSALIDGKDIGNAVTAFLPGCILVLLSVITREQIGMGDGWVILCMGLFLDCAEILWIIFISFMILTVLSIFLLIAQKAHRKTRMPFLPFLLTGFTIYILGGLF